MVQGDSLVPEQSSCYWTICQRRTSLTGCEFPNNPQSDSGPEFTRRWIGNRPPVREQLLSDSVRVICQDTLHPAAIAFIEDLSLIAEADGIPRIAGRIVGLLLVLHEPLSFDDIVEQIHVSRASVSTNTRLLESRGAIRRVSRLGERRDFFEAGPDFLERLYERRIQRERAGRQIAAKARAALPAGYARTKESLKRMEELHSRMIEATENVLISWNRRR